MIHISKYDKLAKYLKKCDQDLIRLNFKEIENIIRENPGDEGLPGASKKHRSWWANSASNNHALNGWLNEGWETSQVDMKKGELVFIRTQQIMQDTLLPGYMPKTRSRRTPQQQQNRMISELDAIVRQVGGLANLSYIIDAIERYMQGDIQEMELGQELRRLWHRRR